MWRMETTSSFRLDSVLRAAAARLPTPEGRREAEQLLAHALGRDRAWLFAHAADRVEARQVAAFHELLQRRIAGEPVAYLIGRRGFWTLDLAVTSETLIPRPETELLVEQALLRLPPQATCRVADLGTGSGAIALAIARERPRSTVIATDASEGALAVAKDNARDHAIDNVQFRHGHWFTPLAGECFDLIASNPPYIADHDPHLRQGDLRHEPAAALSSGADGLDAIREIVAQAPGYLQPGGWLLLEHGWEQGEGGRGRLASSGYAEILTERDLEGRGRLRRGRR